MAQYYNILMMKKLLLLSILTFATAMSLLAQKLPAAFQFSPDGKHLLAGGDVAVKDFYNVDKIHVINLIFKEADYWTILTANKVKDIDLGATLIYDGDTLKSKVGVRFKGQTSFGGGPGGGGTTSQKKSFNISLDFENPDLDIDGYKTFNLNNSYQDASFMKEVFYLNQSKQNLNALKANFVQLKINGQDWGIYQNVQQLNSDYIKEWFMSNDGVRWRALRATTAGGGGGFGAGKSSLNYLGTDTAVYIPNYTLKSTKQLNPWTKLAKACEKLGTTPVANLEDTIVNYLDLDRTLWFLATEIAYADDDSYIWKGGMDYWLYWDPETRRITPLEYDGNSVMASAGVSWSPFYNETNTNFALMNKLFANPSIRQKYIAHLKTILSTEFDDADVSKKIDDYAAKIDAYVNADPKKATTYAAFQSSKATMKKWMKDRKTFILNNAEFKTTAPVINALEVKEVPSDKAAAVVTAKIENPTTVGNVTLYYATGFVGIFKKISMFDDGNNDDGAAGDGIYGAKIPGFDKGTYVRYYITAAANDAKKTIAFFPEGAEHDVFIYQVKQTVGNTDVVINELMASNTKTAADQDGEFDDWIELYNTSLSEVDLSGWFLSDDATNLKKFELPTGTKIAGNGYLIIWADENGKQNGLHANFKFSASGEACYLLKPNGDVVQEVIFNQQESDKGYARVPNGTGNFKIQSPTFGKNNNTVGVKDDFAATNFGVFPNPNHGFFTVKIENTTVQNRPITVFNTTGQSIYQATIQEVLDIDLSNAANGIYFVKIGNSVKKIIKQ
jgi:CotH kinase protein/Lamin Tail Domain/Secretion system C-terminal sorting domain